MSTSLWSVVCVFFSSKTCLTTWLVAVASVALFFGFMLKINK